jgi:hypothetical protein
VSALRLARRLAPEFVAIYFSQITLHMATVLLLIISALLCFALFYKAIEWFEHI